MEKSNKGLIITIIVLVVWVLGLTGYIVYDKVWNKSENNVTNNESTPNKQENNTPKKETNNDVNNNANNNDSKNYDFKGKVTGYITKEKKTSSILEGNGETEELIYFNITSTDNNDITKFIKDYKGNTYVSENGLSLGCFKNNEIVRYNQYDGSTNNNKYVISGSDAQKILNSSINNQITLEIEKLKHTSGGGAPLCYSHITNINIVD